MSAPQQLTSTNPTSLKIRLAYRFLLALNTLNAKRSALDHNQINQRSRRVKIAAYASMASVVGQKRVWSRAILWKIRNRSKVARNKKKVHHITTRFRAHPHHARPTRRRIPNREHADLFGNSGLEVKLRKLVPGSEKMDPCGLLDETADYIKCLTTQVDVMRTLVDFYSTI